MRETFYCGLLCHGVFAEIICRHYSEKKIPLKGAVRSIHFSGTVNCSILGKRTSSSHGDNFKGETWRPSQPKRIRPAFLKRECFRVRDNYMVK